MRGRGTQRQNGWVIRKFDGKWRVWELENGTATMARSFREWEHALWSVLMKMEMMRQAGV